MRERCRVECAWILALSAGPARRQLARLPSSCRDWLAAIARDPGATDVAAIKLIEQRTNHDVKAVEMWIRAELQSRGAAPADLEWVHFGCTSEDINNLAYALMLQAARSQILLPLIGAIVATLDALAERHADAVMLGRTHGQAATPTTMGKEMANFAARLESQCSGIARIVVLGKINGAVGNYNAHFAALPDVDWRGFSRQIRRIARTASERPYDADRTARLDRGVLPRPHPCEHGIAGFVARHVGIYIALLLQAAPRPRGGRFLDDAAQSESNRFRERRRESRHCECAARPLRRKIAGLALATRPQRFDRVAEFRRRRRPLRDCLRVARRGTRQGGAGRKQNARGAAGCLGGARRGRANGHARAWYSRTPTTGSRRLRAAAQSIGPRCAISSPRWICRPPKKRACSNWNRPPIWASRRCWRDAGREPRKPPAVTEKP